MIPFDSLARMFSASWRNVSLLVVLLLLFAGGTYVYAASVSQKCGNGKTEGAEKCDDGNKKSGDGCTAKCRVVNGWKCTGTPSKCTRVASKSSSSSSSVSLSTKSSSSNLSSNSSGNAADVCTGNPVCGNHVLEEGEKCESDVQPYMQSCDSNSPNCRNRIENACCKSCKSFFSTGECSYGTMGAVPIIRDNPAAEGKWKKVSNAGGFQCDYLQATGPGLNSAQGPWYGDLSWYFAVESLIEGYDVYITYPAASDLGTVTYTSPSFVSGVDGSGNGNLYTYLFNAKVDQRISPAGLTYEGAQWKKLFHLYVKPDKESNSAGGFIQVDLHIATGSKLRAVADAVMVVPHTYVFPAGSTTCGDGALGGSETCDDGNARGGDGCSAQCQAEEGWICGAVLGSSYCPGLRPTVCRSAGTNHVCRICPKWDGDFCGLLTSTHSITKSFINVNARTSCNYDGQQSVCSRCGDGIINAGEACDDGNAVNGDGCSQCKIDPDWKCVDEAGAPSVCNNCGNGYVEGKEECDPAGPHAQGGCTDTCTRGGSFQCLTEQDTNQSRCWPLGCGNHILDRGEQCDNEWPKCGDGHNCGSGLSYSCGGDAVCAPRDGDGCNASCRVEPGYWCPSDLNKACVISCGDGGVYSTSEECDDGNKNSFDGCSYPKCRVESGWTCQKNADGKSVCRKPLCGNGVIEGDEGCDDDNKKSGDGCSADCQIESGYTCEGGHEIGVGKGQYETPSRCWNCGNGIPFEGDETCDDGNRKNGDGCSANCELEPGEWKCVSTKNTATTCYKCGNGIVEPENGEQCDDGNTKDGDGCSGDCKSWCKEQSGPAPSVIGANNGKSFEENDSCSISFLYRQYCYWDVNSKKYIPGQHQVACPYGCKDGNACRTMLLKIDSAYFDWRTVYVQYTNHAGANKCPVLYYENGTVWNTTLFCEEGDALTAEIPVSTSGYSGKKVKLCVQNECTPLYTIR